MFFDCAYIHDRYVRVHPLEAEVQWQHQYASSGNTPERGAGARVGWQVRELVLIGGLVLPIWGMVERALVKQHRPADRRMHVLRLHTTGSHTFSLTCSGQAAPVLCCAVLCIAVLCALYVAGRPWVHEHCSSVLLTLTVVVSAGGVMLCSMQ